MIRLYEPYMVSVNIARERITDFWYFVDENEIKSAYITVNGRFIEKTPDDYITVGLRDRYLTGDFDRYILDEELHEKAKTLAALEAL